MTVEILNVDCMECMAGLEDNAFDLAIVDPPYGIGSTWSKSRRDRFYKKGALHEYQNMKIPEQSYFNELFRVSKNQIIWGSNYFTDHLYSTNSWVVWDKNRDSNTPIMSEAELAWTSFSSVLRIARMEWNGFMKCEKITKIHPHQKPIKLYEWLLTNYAKSGQRILDTHLGSGSSAIAAHYFGCDFVGCEIDKGYYDASKQRFREETAQQAMAL